MASVREREKRRYRSVHGDPVESCPECGSESLVQIANMAEVVCDGCGLVVKERSLDRGPEWRAFDQEEHYQRARVGAPRTEGLHDHGLTTQIDWRDEDAMGKMLSSEKRQRMRRLRTWQERIRTNDARERNLQFALSEIHRMASALDVPDTVRETGAVLYRRALDEDLLRGRSIEGVATAAVYAACRQERIPRSLDEFVTVSRVSKTEIGRTYRYLSAELNLELRPFDPAAFVPRFGTALDLDRRVRARATEIIDAATEKGVLAGKSPAGFAGAALYAAGRLCDDRRTQQDVADVANVTEATIRSHYQDQLSALNLDITT